MDFDHSCHKHLAIRDEASNVGTDDPEDDEVTDCLTPIRGYNVNHGKFGWEKTMVSFLKSAGDDPMDDGDFLTDDPVVGEKIPDDDWDDMSQFRNESCAD